MAAVATTMRGLWVGYNRNMKQKPLSTKAATCAIGFAVGDVIAQLSTKRGSVARRIAELDTVRTTRMSAYGVLVAAPMMHYFFSWLDKAIMPNNPKHPVAVISKVAIDQLVQSPAGTCLFFAWNNALQGQPQEIIPSIRDKLWSTTKAGWQLWPAAQAVNMYLVPAHLRVAYIQVVAVFWTNILSRMAAKEPAATQAIVADLEQQLEMLPTNTIEPDVVVDSNNHVIVKRR